MRELSMTPQARKVLRHMEKRGSITQRDALLDHGVQSLHRRLTEITRAGFNVQKDRKVNKATGQRYTRYTLVGRA